MTPLAGGIPQPIDDSTLGAPQSNFRTPSVGGFMQVKSLKQMQAEEKSEAQRTNSSSVVTGLSGYVRQCFTWARMAKQQTVEQRMLQSIRQRRGQYDPETLQKIKQQNGSDIYMGITSVKCRGAVSWLRDVFLATANDKPWKLEPTPVPDLPPEYQQSLIAIATQQVTQLLMEGQLLQGMDVQELLVELKEQQLGALNDEAKEMVHLMELKMEDQLDEGGFTQAFSSFLDDLVTFPSAIIKGPVVVNKPALQWVADGPAQDTAPSPLDGTNPDAMGADAAEGQVMPQHPSRGGSLQVVNKLSLEWKRVDPFNAYPAPEACDINDGYFIEHHRLRRLDLQDLIGVPGYSDAAIRGVLDDYGRGGIREWLTHEMLKKEAEGKLTSSASQNDEGLIDALQFWGSVQGKMLLDWGMTDEEIPDPLKEYHVEVWVIGSWVIKVTLNYDPLARKPYYKTSYETVPGTFWGNSVCDLVRDCQTMCNNAARAIANNMGIASGPQVAINVERTPAGADLTEMYPWKVWQVTSDPMGSAQPPMQFFQPDDRVAPLQKLYETFAELADEYSGVPRYMTGTDGTPGAGRTASGLSMMINNAGKVIKQVINNVDTGIITPLLERLYFYNMRYGTDNALKGDVNVIARGTLALLAQEAAQVRRNEFLQLVLNSPIAQQITGVEGTAALMREGAKALDMDVDKIVPNAGALKRKIMEQNAQAQQAQMAAQANGQVEPPPQPGGPGQPPSGPAAAPPTTFPKKPTLGAGPMRPNGQPLLSGRAQTDHFSPPKR